MRTWIVCAAIIAGVLPACTDDGGACEAPQLAPVEENASGRALSCVEQVALDGVTYAPWCAQVLDERLGARVGEGQGYAARSLVGVSTTTALAVARLDDTGSPQTRGDCQGWTFAPSFDISNRYAQSIAQRVLEPEDRADL